MRDKKRAQILSSQAKWCRKILTSLSISFCPLLSIKKENILKSYLLEKIIVFGIIFRDWFRIVVDLMKSIIRGGRWIEIFKWRDSLFIFVLCAYICFLFWFITCIAPSNGELSTSLVCLKFFPKFHYYFL